MLVGVAAMLLHKPPFNFFLLIGLESLYRAHKKVLPVSWTCRFFCHASCFSCILAWWAQVQASYPLSNWIRNLDKDAMALEKQTLNAACSVWQLSVFPITVDLLGLNKAPFWHIYLSSWFCCQAFLVVLTGSYLNAELRKPSLLSWKSQFEKEG